ncbi:TPA: hypothetical protein N0F65_004937 [Lagenidium giganteum]|uniref:Uncharacterized protein n=1 Tax=Lagenidium giganteum TaxID=4803 RepID=A0AAV2YWV6_9STRA|nr:TPA: hypothetical protein N0F65_004937 [Lagenidium giganteum]
MSKKYCLCERRPRPRVRIYYEDEDMRARYNANATRVLALVQQDPTATTSHAQMALKVLKYRKMAERAAGIDLQDPTFDVAQFFGIEWCKSTPVREGNIP